MKNHGVHLLVAAMSITGLSAQTNKAPRDHRPPPPLLLPVLDSNKDGELSETEIKNSSIALAGLDKNEDGSLSRKEIAPPPPKKKKARRPRPRKGSPILVKTIDLDGDGSLSADEIEDAPLSLGTLDSNGDGLLSREELKPGKSREKKPV